MCPETGPCCADPGSEILIWVPKQPQQLPPSVASQEGRGVTRKPARLPALCNGSLKIRVNFTQLPALRFPTETVSNLVQAGRRGEALGSFRTEKKFLATAQSCFCPLQPFLRRLQIIRTHPAPLQHIQNAFWGKEWKVAREKSKSAFVAWLEP